MIILVNGVDSLADYETRREDLDKNLRPTLCPTCQKDNTFWRHGKYVRKVIDGVAQVEVSVRRFKCGNCGLIVSCIFSFIAPYVRFAVAKIADAVQQFSDNQMTYSELASELSEINTETPPTPSSTQVFRWIHRVATKAHSLLFQLQKELVMRGAASLLGNFFPPQSPNEKSARRLTNKRLTDLRRVSLFIDCDPCRQLFHLSRFASEDSTAWYTHSQELLRMAENEGWYQSSDGNCHFCPRCLEEDNHLQFA